MSTYFAHLLVIPTDTQSLLQEFIVKHINLLHNHDVDQSTFALYRDNRQPTGPLLEQAHAMLSTGANPTLVTQYVNQRQLPVKPRDICNIKQRMKITGTPQEELETALSQPDVTYSIVKDDQDILTCVAFCTTQQKEWARQYGGVVLMDGTYRINKYRMPLYTLAVVDSEGHRQPIAHALVAREDCASLVLFLTTAVQWFPTLASAIFITDKDYAEITAIRQVLPGAAIHLCRFHMLKAFVEELKKQQLHNDRELYLVFKRLLL